MSVPHALSMCGYELIDMMKHFYFQDNRLNKTIGHFNVDIPKEVKHSEWYGIQKDDGVENLPAQLIYNFGHEGGFDSIFKLIDSKIDEGSAVV